MFRGVVVFAIAMFRVMVWAAVVISVVRGCREY